MPQQNNLTVKNITSSGFDLYPSSLPAITSDYEVTVTAIMSDGTELEETKTITLEVLPAESITATGDSTITDYDTHYYTLNFIRTTDNKTPNVGVKEFTTTTSDTGITVTKTETGFSLKADSGLLITKNVTVNIRATMDDDEIVTGSKTILINLVKITGAVIVGDARAKAPKSITKDYLFTYTPSNYTIQPGIPTVTTNRSDKITISNVTIVGFSATFNIVEDDDFTATITATFPENVTTTHTVSVIYGIEPNTHAVGEIYCSDGTYITPTLNWTNGTCTSIDLGGKTPIGIVVVPGSHMPDGTARIMSLLECDLSNPSTPTTSHNSMKWGANVDTPLTNYNTLPKLDGTTGNSGYQGTKWSYWLLTDLDSTTGLYYNSYQPSSRIKSPYLSDGVSQDTSSLVGLMSDFDGKENTATLISLATSDTNWRTGSITNSSEAGYYPTACCCYRYVTPGTQEGDWYLPACGELVYVIYYFKLFNSILSKLNELNSGSAVGMTSSKYWSSSESSSGSSYFVYMYTGQVFREFKDSSSSSVCIRPFLSVP